MTTKPNLTVAATAAGVLWAGAAFEAMSYARRTRARAESIIQIPVSGTTGGAEAYLAWPAIARRRSEDQFAELQLQLLCCHAACWLHASAEAAQPQLAQ